MVTEKEVRQASEAERILESDVFKLSLENLKKEYLQAWITSKKPDDIEARENLHKSILLLPEIEKHLRIIAEKGKLTKANINKVRNIG
jgi:hypothetical protein|tara:strand:+ start:335 stop:598 length:264 start_codon:yes stop_codon:yes gene_type:complete